MRMWSEKVHIPHLPQATYEHAAARQAYLPGIS